MSMDYYGKKVQMFKLCDLYLQKSISMEEDVLIYQLMLKFGFGRRIIQNYINDSVAIGKYIKDGTMLKWRAIKAKASADT